MESKIGKEQPNTWYNNVFKTASHYHKSWDQCGDWTNIWVMTVDYLKQNMLTRRNLHQFVIMKFYLFLSYFGL